MTQLFTATGTAECVTLLEYGMVQRDEFQFNHVIRANDADEANEKLFDYYFGKRTDLEWFEINEVAIWDMIE